jgi:hypothetical protein
MGEARVDLDGHPAIDAVGGVVDRPEHVAGAAYIGYGEQPQHLSGGGSSPAEFSDLIGVVGAAADSVREDRRIGRDPDDVAVFDQPVQRASGEQLPA